MAQNDSTTQTDTDTKKPAGLSRSSPPLPGLLIPHTLPDSVSVDRCIVEPPFVVGRSDEANLVILDNIISGRHFEILREQGGYRVRDLSSKNGTYMNEVRMTSPEGNALLNGDLIRAGHTLLVFREDMSLLMHPPVSTFGMVGPFHTEPIIEQLETAADSSRHILITGPTGVGKELAARALVSLRKMDDCLFIIHNAARFSSEEEAVASLFGVAKKVFSNVSARPGFIEEAHGGTLFLDEAHHLPERIQRALLRVIENQELSRLGETEPRKTDVRLIFASNDTSRLHGLVHDLFHRLRRVDIPPLCDRIADIPKMFDTVLESSLSRFSIRFDAVRGYLAAEHYTALMRHGFVENNVRGLIDLADRIATRTANGMDPESAVQKTFVDTLLPPESSTSPQSLSAGKEDRNGTDHASHYEDHRDEIIKVYLSNKGNLSKTVDALTKLGISTSRRWLSAYAKLWALPSKYNLKEE